MATSYVLFNVTVPARVKVFGSFGADPAKRTIGDSTSSENLSFAEQVRDFIVDHSELEWISEEPFINGNAWWISFQFSCLSSYAETCLLALGEAGIGDEETGRGMVHVMPVFFRHVGTRPHACGRPSSLPYSSPLTPPTSPRSPTLRKRAVTTVPMGNVAEDEEGVVTTVKESVSGETTVTFLEDEYDDGAEIENQAERLQAKLIEEVEADERNKDRLQKYTENFQDTVKSRVAVDALVQYVTAASEFSFDYVMLIILAAMIACVGLVTNNIVVIVASMLVSPLMGPILAETLGTVLADWELVKRGLFAESIGLALCLLVGFIGGLCAAPANGDTWPTDEMSSRAVPSALYIGVAIAIPSGMGAALSVMGNNTSSLVGVAISASLLPPAVNAGILFAGWALEGTGIVGGNNEVYPYRSAGVGAVISFLLTVINIVCIFFSAYAMFELKEVRGKSIFWKEDVKKVRKYNRAVRADSGVASIYKKAFDSADREKNYTDSGQRRAFVDHYAPLEKLKGTRNLMAGETA